MKLSRLLPRSLVTRVYALYAATLLLFVGTGLVLFFQNQVRQGIADAQDSATMLVEVAAQVIGESAVIGDYDTIQRTLDRSIARSQFESGAFIDIAGGVLNSRNAAAGGEKAPEWLRESVAGQLYDVNRNISVGGVDYGVLRLRFDVDSIALALWQLLVAAVALAAAALVGGMLLIWFPLKHWLGTLERVRGLEGDLARGVNSGTELIDEVPSEFRPMFELLASTSNTLRQELASREHALTSLRALLETMLPADAARATAGEDELAAVTQMIGNLVVERETGRLALDNQKFALDQHAIVSITDHAGHIAYANDRFCNSAGYPRDAFIGQTHRILKSGVHPPAFYADLWRTILDGRVWKGEMCNRARDGSLYWFASTIVPLVDATGKPDQFISICTDITARKRAEAELQEAKDAAESANRAKSEFLANMSHEIRTPMNGIIGMTDLALDTNLSSEQRDYLLTVKSSADALLTIINDILDFSKIEAGKLSIESIPLDPRELVGDAMRLLQPRAEEKRLRFAADIATGVPARVAGDPVRLRQILLNLVGNALKFTEEGEIRVTLSATAGTEDDTAELHFAVSDTGIGISAEKQAHIFEAFAQEDGSTSRRFGGTGLGLSISRRLVELMHGEMRVESTPGRGSTFHFTLPLPVAPDSAESAPQGTTTTAATAAAGGGGARVLLVEDNRVNQRVAATLLERRGYQVTIAENGVEALAARSTASFDAILMDMQMPVMDGLEATREIRRREADGSLTPHVPIIAMTANAMQSDRDACIDAGMDDYVSKPINAARLFDVLGRWIKTR